MKRPNLLLTTSAVVYLLAAVAMLFAPAELLEALGQAPSAFATSVIQLLGSAIFGFGMLNWMHRHSVIGGIFGRPLVVANLAHSGSAALLLASQALDRQLAAPLLAVLAVHAGIAIGFGIHLFGPRGTAAAA